MLPQEAINFVDIARMNYICDPKECGLEKGKDTCTAFHCDEMHDALAMAIEALEKQIPKKPKYAGEVPVCSCGMNLSKEEFSYCRYCGQAIDWSDTDE